MITEEEITKKITSKGYWKVTIRPLKLTKRFSVRDAKSWLEKVCVKYYGWKVPVITNDSEQCFFGQDYVEGLFDKYGVVEKWRLHSSGQLVYYRGFIEDWQPGKWYAGIMSRQSGKPVEKVKGIAVTVNEITMFYQLAKQMVENSIQDEKLYVSIELHDVLNRTLATDSPMAMLYDDYICRIPEIKIESEYTKEQLLNYQQLSMSALLEIATMFNWTGEGVGKALENHMIQYLKGE